MLSSCQAVFSAFWGVSRQVRRIGRVGRASVLHRMARDEEEVVLRTADVVQTRGTQRGASRAQMFSSSRTVSGQSRIWPPKLSAPAENTRAPAGVS